VLLFSHYFLFVEGETPSDVEIKDFIRGIEKYALASHLFWGLWGIISVSRMLSKFLLPFLSSSSLTLYIYM
jgi:choline/ethanolamine kinase